MQQPVIIALNNFLQGLTHALRFYVLVHFEFLSALPDNFLTIHFKPPLKISNEKKQKNQNNLQNDTLNFFLNPKHK